MTTLTPAQQETLAAPLGKLVSGVSILTTDSAGMLTSWAMQAGFAPPMITVAIAHEREIMKTVEASKTFVLNILNTQNQRLMGKFGKYHPDAFADLAIRKTPYGVILEDTLGYLE